MFLNGGGGKLEKLEWKFTIALKLKKNWKPFGVVKEG